MEAENILVRALVTEKTIRMAERDNKVAFIVNRNANKTQIKEAVEKIFNVKVEKVNTLILPNGEKKAYVKLKKDYKATDVLSKLGLM
ncbi:50S ribosomal protein L23 [Nanoarchaeota archaeon NZ13-N]|uniref:Large ribosomal subunit protein uL23 n=1 Tax=Candidatus Nanoclepta minutus TaxID=1940235 RepID=A0A397WQ97_9ARCH|nr:MAG: 50S ribosomal protein L23 [Nanoarchaeota archaeon NZ13-N]RIB35263.1 MAG: 50S ribosomal protein L23 [Candidatus Nanoclepta minutus]